jgi:ketosteroid isomerase-like protein
MADHLPSAKADAELVARLFRPFPETGELDWTLVDDRLVLCDHELPDGDLFHGKQGWLEWLGNWEASFAETRIEVLELLRVDDASVLVIQRLTTRGRGSGVDLERRDAQILTFGDGKLVRVDYYGSEIEARRAAGLE